MIVYKIDKLPHAKASSQIRDMKAVLDEIAPTLQILQDLIRQHQATISSPSINNFTEALLYNIADVVKLAESVTERSLRLCAVSEQASKHLAAIEEHFGAVLRNKPVDASQVQAQVVA